MLKISFLRNPRFGMASLGLSFAAFALFGAIFALTQYLQDAHGYSALQAGAGMIPVAFGLMAGAGSSHKLVARAGTGRVITAGLLGLATMLTLTQLWTPHMPYWPIGLWFFGLALSMGWVMGPATASVMGSVPEEKSGVASAMNDVTRQVGGALGVAVTGSLISSLYASRISDSASGLSEAARATAQDSIGQANQVAATLPTSEGASLTDSAAKAFTDALGSGFTVAAVAAVLAAVAVKLWLPSAPVAEEAEVVENEPEELRE